MVDGYTVAREAANIWKVNRSHRVSTHGAEETQWICILCYLLWPFSMWKQSWPVDTMCLVTLEEDMFYSVGGSAPTQTIPWNPI